MAINTEHPEYSDKKDKWVQMTHTKAGIEAVKGQDDTYLPYTSGMIKAGAGTSNTEGQKAYEAYKSRAMYYNYVGDSEQRLVGMMHREDARVDLPDSLKPLMTECTLEHESIQDVLRKINAKQLTHGRVGVLMDIQDGAKLPHMVFYDAEAIINWTTEGDKVTLVVLDETGQEWDPVKMVWTEVSTYRILKLIDGVYKYTVTKDTSNVPGDDEFKAISFSGQELDEIPFVFINASDLLSSPGEIPLKGVSDLSLAVYRLDADYRQALFMQGQDTLVISGASHDGKSPPVALGAAAQINLPAGADAKFIGVNAQGLSAMEKQLEMDKQAAGELGAKLLDMSDSSGRASGDALRVRVSAKTATLVDIAKAGAKGLTRVFKLMAKFVGAEADEIKITANLDFADDDLLGQDLLNYMQSKRLGAPLSLESIHAIMLKKDLTNKTYEEELAAIAEEEDLFMVDPGGPGVEDPETNNGPDSE